MTCGPKGLHRLALASPFCRLVVLSRVFDVRPAHPPIPVHSCVRIVHSCIRSPWRAQRCAERGGGPARPPTVIRDDVIASPRIGAAFLCLCRDEHLVYLPLSATSGEFACKAGGHHSQRPIKAEAQLSGGPRRYRKPEPPSARVTYGLTTVFLVYSEKFVCESGRRNFFE